MLKIIGIILLVILGIILFVLLSILFVPIRYKASGFYNTDYSVTATASWLFHILSLKVNYAKDNELSVKGRVFGIKVYDNQKKSSTDTEKNDDYTAAEDELCSKELEHIAKSDNSFNDKIPSVKDKQVELIINDETSENESRNEKSFYNKKGLTKRTKKHFSPFKKLWMKIKKTIENIRYTIKKIYDKIIDIKNNINYYLKLFKKESTKRALKKCKNQLFRVLKNILPRKFKVDLHLGFEDPQTMGQILGYWGELYPIHNGNIIISPEYDKNVIEGKFAMKGRITGIVILWAICTFLFDKDIKIFLRRLKREDR